MEDGYVKLFRVLKDSPLMKNGKALQLFIYIILSANYKEARFPFNGKDVVVPAGSVITGRRKLANNTCMSEKNVRTALGYLKQANIVAIKSTNKFSIVQVVNWDKYQMTGQQSGQDGGQQGANKGPTRGQQRATYKKVKKENKVKEGKELNTITSKSATSTSEISSINYDFYMSYWNANIQHCPKIVSLSDKRKSMLFFRESGDKEFTKHFEICVGKINDSKFLSGVESSWQADFDFVVKNDTNYLKILEGRYENSEDRIAEQEKKEKLRWLNSV